MKKLIIIISSIVLVIALVLLGITTDFHSYKKNSKDITLDNNKLVFTITTFDGKSETKPFVKSLGHAWVSVENNLDHSVYIKDYEIVSGEEVTFSIWAIKGHFGVAFNMEPNFMKQYDRYKGRQSISTNILESDLKTIENFMDLNDYWLPTKNCSYWSIHVWNEIVSDEYKMKTQTVLYTPTRLQKSFSEFNNVVVDKDFSNCKKIYFYLDGNRTELSLCD